jgi:hypothetical protein
VSGNEKYGAKTGQGRMAPTSGAYSTKYRVKMGMKKPGNYACVRV